MRRSVRIAHDPRGRSPQLEHPAQNGEAPRRREPFEYREGRAHRLGACVIAVVDDRNAAGRIDILPAARGRIALERGGRVCEGNPATDARQDRRQGV